MVDIEKQQGPSEGHGGVVNGVGDDQRIEEYLCHHQTLKWHKQVVKLKKKYKTRPGSSNVFECCLMGKLFS